MPRRRSDEQARRLIALLGRLHDGERLSLTALAEQLGTTPAELADDIVTLSLCGVAPYDPLGLVPVSVEGDVVEVFGDVPALRGPVRLSATEAGALAAALQAAGFGADEPLTARLLDASSTAFDAAEVEHVVRAGIAGHDTGVYETLARAVEEHLPVQLEYTTAGSDTATLREVEPLALFAERGAWYLTAWCRTARAWRTFRLDRATSALIVEGEAVGQHEGAPVSARAFDPEGLPLARLRFADAREFTAREWPDAIAETPADDGSVEVAVPYAGTEWLGRTVVARLGSVEVLEPLEVRQGVAALASRLLAEL